MSSYRGSYEDMGSTLSTNFGPQRKYRLSKPRTNNSPNNPTPLSSRVELSSPASSSNLSPVIGKSDGVGLSPSVESKTRRESRIKLKDTLSSPSEELEEPEHSADEDISRLGLADTSRSVRGRLSRTGTTIAKRTSLRLSLNPLAKSTSRLSLAREMDMEEVEDHEQVIDKIKEKAFYDRMAALNHISPSEGNGDPESLLSPIRRRSLFTPGLATRNVSDILRKPPPPQNRKSVDLDYYYNPNLSESSPLARLASLDLARDGRLTPITRSSTPADLDYGHLGGFGTLRITNGMASPVPSTRSSMIASRHSSAEQNRDGCFPMPEVRAHLDRGSARPVLKEIHRRSGEFVDLIDTPRRADRRSAEIGRVGRPLETQRNSRVLEGSPLKSTYWVEDEFVESRASTLTRTRRALSFSANGNDLTNRLAEGYMADIPDSPFGSQLNVDAFAATSKPNEIEDDLFEEQGLATASSSQSLRKWKTFLEETDTQDRGCSFEEDTLGVLSGIGPSRPRSNQNLVSKPLPEEPRDIGPDIRSDEVQPKLKKVDSGYSSSTSMKSIQKRRMAVQTEPKKLRPAIKLNNSTASYNSGFGSIPVKNYGPMTAPMSRPQLSIPAQSYGSSLVSSFKTSTDTIPTLASSRTSMSIGTSSEPNKKLKKRRPKSQPPPVDRITVQGLRELGMSDIPPIPIDIAARNAERIRNFPPLAHTLPSADHVELLNGSNSPVLLSPPIRFPSPTRHAGDQDPPKGEISRSIWGNRRLSNDQAANRDSFEYGRKDQIKVVKRSNRPSIHEEQRYSGTIADFGDVSAALGGSPYDIAQFTTREHSPSKRNSGVLYPHQMTNALPRTKSMYNMSAEEASQIARMRSLFRSTSQSAEDHHQVLMDRPTARRFSPTNANFNDRGGIPGKLLRPKSFRTDAPPVPSIPVAVQVRQREAEVPYSQDERHTQISQTQVQSSIQSIYQRYPFVDGSWEQPIDWDVHQESWAGRRKSIGETLRPQTAKSYEATHSVTMQSPSASRPKTSRETTTSTSFTTSSHVTRSFHSSTHVMQQPMQSRPKILSRQTIQVPEGTVARLSGRFEGGLGFVGGSAGTDMRTGTGRKSVEISRVYGVDLGDVPIFITPRS